MYSIPLPTALQWDVNHLNSTQTFVHRETSFNSCLSTWLQQQERHNKPEFTEVVVAMQMFEINDF